MREYQEEGLLRGGEKVSRLRTSARMLRETGAGKGWMVLENKCYSLESRVERVRRGKDTGDWGKSNDWDKRKRRSHTQDEKREI